MVAGTRTSTSPGTSRINISHRPSSSSATSTKRRCHVTFQHFCMQMQIYSSMTTCHTGCTCCSLYAKKWWHACSSNIYSWLPSRASSDKHECPSVRLSLHSSIHFLGLSQSGPQKKTCFCPYEFNASP